jgi:hypothetical protein
MGSSKHVKESHGFTLITLCGVFNRKMLLEQPHSNEATHEAAAYSSIQHALSCPQSPPNSISILGGVGNSPHQMGPWETSQHNSQKASSTLLSYTLAAGSNGSSVPASPTTASSCQAATPAPDFQHRHPPLVKRENFNTVTHNYPSQGTSTFAGLANCTSQCAVRLHPKP